MKESEIVHENGRVWVHAARDSYTVYVSGICVSMPDTSYAKDTDGLSIAKARADYLATRDLDAIYTSLARAVRAQTTKSARPVRWATGK